MKKISKLLFSLFMAPAFMLGIKDNAHVVKAEATPVAGTEATLAVSSVIKEAVTNVAISLNLEDSLDPNDANYLKTWKNIEDVVITNNPDDIANNSNANPKIYIGEPFEVGESGTKTSVTSRTGNTKDYYVAGFLFKYELIIGNSPSYYLVLYADVENIYANKNSSGLFSEMIYLQRLNLKCFNTERVEDFSYMFADCQHLQNADFLKEFDKPSVNNQGAKNLSGMFKNCFWLTSIDFNNYLDFCSNKIDSFEEMFYGCEILTSVNMSPLDGSNVTNIRRMFMHCPLIKTIDLSFITSKNIKYCYQAFDCDSSKKYAVLREVNISGMGLSNVDLTGPNGENELDLFFSADTDLRIVYAPQSLPEGKSIRLPVDFHTIKYLTNETCSTDEKIQRICCIPDIFEQWWFELRDNNNGNLCAALIPGSLDREDLEYMLEEYDKMDPIDQEEIDKRWDVEEENLTIKDSMDYLRAVLNGTQSTDGDYSIKTNNEGNNITFMSLENTRVSVIIIIAISSIIALASYAIIMRKKYN